MEIWLIRHGKTKGNTEKRYIGITDEPLLQEGIAEIGKKNYLPADAVIASSMKRCVQTAEIIYPNNEIITDSRLNECNFGDFEGKNYSDLNGSADYQKWIDSNGKIPFPNGESMEEFKSRCILGFEDYVMKFWDKNRIVFVVHGGTIMSVLEACCHDGRQYFDFMCDHLNGFCCIREEGRCTNIRSLL